jgi:curved DNA-binding protein CbpA
VTDMLDRAAGTAAGAADAHAGGDAFAVLGLPYSPDLTDEDVRRAWRARMRAVHPDAGGDNAAAAAVTAAYEALRSGVRRGELLAAAMTERTDPSPVASGPGRAGRSSRPDAARRAELRAMVAVGRQAQGLPPNITDAATLARIAELMIAMEPGAGARDRAPLPAGADWRPAAGRSPWRVSSWRSEGRRRFMRDYEIRETASVAAVEQAGTTAWRARWAQVRYGRPGWLAGRIMLAAAAVAGALFAAPGDPAVPGLAVGAATWLVLTGRLDLAPRIRR